MNVEAGVKLHLFPHSHKFLEGITPTHMYTTYGECFAMNHINLLPLLFKTLLYGQKDCVFFSGHLNLRTTPETGLPSRKKKIITIKLEKTE